MVSARSSRGRRPGPGPSATPATQNNDCDSIVAWLLRANRLYGHDEDLAVASRFAPMLIRERYDRPASESQVSRWEHGSQRVPHIVIQRYERLLDIDDGRITAVADTFYRERLGRLGPPTLQRQSQADVDLRDSTAALLDRALGREVMSGRDWDQLTANLWELPAVLLHPKSLWHQLAQRLLAELLIAEGPAWLYRSEAINRLLGHRDGATPVIEACAEVIGDRHSQIFIEPMALLELTPRPDAARQLLQQITSPTNAHALRGAWWAVAEKIGRGHLTPEQLAMLAREAVNMLRDRSHPACRPAAAEALRQTLPAATPALLGVIRRLAQDDSVTRHVLELGTMSSTEAIRAVAGRIVGRALTGMPREILRQDPTLERLIAEMLYHPQGTRRVVAAQAIGATPYRLPVGEAIGSELRRSSTLADVTLAGALIQALAHLGGAGERKLLERLIFSQGLPSSVRDTAAWAVGHVRAEGDPAFWPSAMDRIMRVGKDYEHLSEASAKGLVYSLGTARRHDDLARLATSVEVHADLRVAAIWWLRIPSLIQHSALR